MVRRSKATKNFSKQVNEIKSFLDDFLQRIEGDDLRAQVLSLIPAFHSLKGLGSGLIVSDKGNSARDRILAYFRKYPFTLIDGDEIAVVSGIGEWARRVRELRVEFGWSIYAGKTLSELAEESTEVIEQFQKIVG